LDDYIKAGGPATLLLGAGVNNHHASEGRADRPVRREGWQPGDPPPPRERAAGNDDAVAQPATPLEQPAKATDKKI